MHKAGAFQKSDCFVNICFHTSNNHLTGCGNVVALLPASIKDGGDRQQRAVGIPQHLPASLLGCCSSCSNLLYERRRMHLPLHKSHFGKASISMRTVLGTECIRSIEAYRRVSLPLDNSAVFTVLNRFVMEWKRHLCAGDYATSCKRPQKWFVPTAYLDAGIR